MAGKDEEIRIAVNIFFAVMIDFIENALKEASKKENLRPIAAEIFTHWEGLFLMSKTQNSLEHLGKIKSYTQRMFQFAAAS
jgi:hypothetical protein